jgi:hypothetical protein
MTTKQLKELCVACTFKDKHRVPHYPECPCSAAIVAINKYGKCLGPVTPK